MSESTKARAGRSARRVLRPVPPAPEVSSTYLAPAAPFPGALADLELVELHVLHSRITRQLELEYRTDPDGPHPVTLDHAQELAAELDTRQEFLTLLEQVPPAGPRVEAPLAVRARATSSRPGPATGQHLVAAEQPAPASLGRAAPRPPAARRGGGAGPDRDAHP